MKQGEKMKLGLFTKVMVSGLLLSLPAVAKDEVHTKQVHFDKGTSGTTVSGSIQGYESYNYKIGANANQYMRVYLETKHKATYMNIYAPGKGPGEEAMFIGSTKGDSFTGALPAKGNYTIQVFMMRSAARRNETANYQLHIGID